MSKPTPNKSRRPHLAVPLRALHGGALGRHRLAPRVGLLEALLPAVADGAPVRGCEDGKVGGGCSARRLQQACCWTAFDRIHGSAAETGQPQPHAAVTCSSRAAAQREPCSCCRRRSCGLRKAEFGGRDGWNFDRQDRPRLRKTGPACGSSSGQSFVNPSAFHSPPAVDADVGLRLGGGLAGRDGHHTLPAASRCHRGRRRLRAGAACASLGCFNICVSACVHCFDQQLNHRIYLPLSRSC
jgi:hypothetical protein